jgi:hypothetical protein
MVELRLSPAAYHSESVSPNVTVTHVMALLNVNLGHILIQLSGT